jgi:phytol kinase
VGLCLILAEVAGRVFGFQAEHTRKFTHVGSGAIIFFTPWLLESVWSVGILCGGFAVVLTLSDKLGLLRSVHAVKRRTFGVYLYPIAVFTTYVLADGDALLFQVAILVMALSDTVAALVGQRAGQVLYRVGDGNRSLEGSAAFFALTFLLVMLSLVVAGRGVWPDLLLITLLVALLATAVEAISLMGFDNLLIPYSVVFILGRTLSLSLSDLGDWVLGMVMVLTVLLVTAWRVRLVATGFVLVAVVGYLAWVLAGPAWFFPLAGLYLAWVATRDLDSLPPEGVGVEAVFPMVATAFTLLMLHAHTGWEGLYTPFVLSVGANALLAFGTPWRTRIMGTTSAGALGLLALLA